MKKKEFETLGRRLLPDLPGFAVKGELLFAQPIAQILRGVCFDRSIDTRSFYVEVFVQPLFVPSKHLVFNFGRRLGGGCRSWNADAPDVIAELSAELRRDALPFLSHVESVLDFVEVAKSFSSANPHTPKAIAFALARAGQTSQAVEVLDQLLSQLDLNVAWQREIADQAKALKAKLVTNPIEAQQQLDAWEAETVHNLGLDDFVIKRPI